MSPSALRMVMSACGCPGCQSRSPERKPSWWCRLWHWLRHKELSCGLCSCFVGRCIPFFCLQAHSAVQSVCHVQLPLWVWWWTGWRFPPENTCWVSQWLAGHPAACALKLQTSRPSADVRCLQQWRCSSHPDPAPSPALPSWWRHSPKPWWSSSANRAGFF